MFKNIRADTLRVHRRSKTLRLSDFLRALWGNYGLQALVIYRFGRWLSDMHKYRLGWLIVQPLYPAFWLLSAFTRQAYGINLEQNADIAPGLYIGHFGGVEVKNCRIGPHCAIQQQVKLGTVKMETETAAAGPVIGAGVWIGAHAQIDADVHIGDGATIGAGSVVTQDIPQHCLVLGNPGRIAQREYDNRAFL
jgi:serine O-acetyltransferase